ncbi:MAG: cobamide remodeling phosphodiesterase CbiR [Thermodesulfobacteriota bacterium]
MTADEQPEADYPRLARSYKQDFNFRLATTSFIYPDHILPNVRMLAPFLNEIELLFFESSYPGSLPGADAIQELKQLAQTHNITYNIHLPLDRSLTAAAAGDRQAAIDTLKYILDLAAPLTPSTWTLHLPEEDIEQDFAGWYERARDSLSRICPRHIRGSQLSVETLSYPLEWIDPLITEFDLSICLDIGHMAIHGLDWKTFYQSRASRIPSIHFYGFDKAHEHKGLEQLSSGRRREIAALLKTFSGTLCLEVFSMAHLQSSLTVLGEMMT